MQKLKLFYVNIQEYFFHIKTAIINYLTSCTRKITALPKSPFSSTEKVKLKISDHHIRTKDL